MSAVSPSRLGKRRTYPGTIYGDSGIARAVERTGAEWIQMISFDGLRLELNAGDGSLAAYKGADLHFEIYPDGVAA